MSPGTALTLLGLTLLLTGCIRPDAAPLNGSIPTIPVGPGTNQSIIAPTAQQIPNTPLPTVAGTIPTPLPTIQQSAATAIIQGLPLAQDGVWRVQPIGPESVVIMFFHDPNGATCIRYIFRSIANARCASPGQALAIIAGTLTTADNAVHTIIAGRTLDGQVSTAVVEFSGSPAQAQPISNGGFLLVVNGKQAPVDAAPVNQTGNLVGGKVAF